MRVPVGPAARLASWIVRAGRRLWRFRPADDSASVAFSGGALGRGPLRPAIYTLWHEHLLPLAALHAGTGAALLTSRHRDGEIVARALERLGYRAARGSSTRGGSAGLRGMVRAAAEGRPLAFTPDGPRGPARRCKAGVVHAAALTGLPVVAVGAAARRGWRLPSWDAFLVPAPGTTVVVAYGEPLTVPAAAREEAGLWTPRLEAAIDAAVSRCEARLRERSA